MLEQLFQEENKSRKNASESSNDPSTFPYVHPPKHYCRIKIGRRRSTNPTYMPALRIFRRDIRRRYGEMFVNVSNNHDASLMEKFINEFCTPDCKFITVKPKDEESRRALDLALKKGEGESSTSTMKQLVQGMAMNYELMPDSVFRLSECNVRVKQGMKGSTVTSKAIIRGTRLYYVELEKHSVSSNAINGNERSNVEELEEIVSSDEGSVNSGTSSESITLNRSDSSSDENSLKHQLVHTCEPQSSPCGLEGNDSEVIKKVKCIPIETPMETLMEAIFTMTLDEMHRIQLFQMNALRYTERPSPLASNKVLIS